MPSDGQRMARIQWRLLTAEHTDVSARDYVWHDGHILQDGRLHMSLASVREQEQ